MASSAVSQRPLTGVPGGVTSNGGSAKVNSTKEWGRSGEPGAAFQGISRARGGERAGRGGGRGSRGSRGAASQSGPRSTAAGRVTSNDSAVKTEGIAAKAEDTTGKADRGPMNKSEPRSLQLLPPSDTSLTKPVNSDRSAKAKPPSRRSSKSIPSLSINPAPLNSGLSTEASVPPTPRSAGRRRRSQQHNKLEPGTPVVKQNLSADLNSTQLKASAKVKLGSTSVERQSSKDVPPHLLQKSLVTPMKADIDALVERVRAVANRPTTPGSHIDWAGDEDEGLPDLDDWGITTSTTSTTTLSISGKNEMISPILEDTLRPLPDFNGKAGSRSPSDIDATLPALQTHDSDVSRGGSQTSSSASDDSLDRGTSSVSSQVPSPTSPIVVDSAPSNIYDESETTCPTPRNAARPTANSGEPEAPSLTNSLLGAVQPLHPSLPAKPVATGSLPKVRKGAIPMREPMPLASVKPSMAVVDTTPIAEEGLDQSIHAPAPKVAAGGESAQDPNPVVEAPADTEEGQGLTASMHAPSDKLQHPATHQPFPGEPHQTRNDARPAGRLNPPFSGLNTTHANHRYSRSGSSTPGASLGGRGGRHGRTQSSPPTGLTTTAHRAPHATRPIITGDAISRLARTIGGSTVSSRSTSVASRD